MDRRQKKRERHRRKRKQNNKKTRSGLSGPSSARGIVRRAVRFPMGPAFISDGWDAMEKVPNLVSVVVTRQLPNGQFVLGVALVDRTCLGIKNSMVKGPLSLAELMTSVEEVGRGFGGVSSCTPLTAQSVVYHALDYAARLGFRPNRDFPAPLFGPRPEQLEDTPFANEEQPFYMAGPRDNVAHVIARLDASVGPGNYHYLIGSPPDDLDEDDY